MRLGFQMPRLLPSSGVEEVNKKLHKEQIKKIKGALHAWSDKILQMPENECLNTHVNIVNVIMALLS